MAPQKLKVLFVSQIYGQQIHGPSRKLVLLAEGFSKHFSITDIRVLTEDATLITENDYLLTYKKKSRPLNFLGKYWRSAKYFNRAKEIYQTWPFDILVFNDAPKAFHAVAGTANPFKVVAMLNDTNSLDNQRRSYETFRKFKVRRLLTRLERKVARRADLIICPSSYLAERVASTYKLDNLPSVLHPAINLQEWNEVKREAIIGKKTLLFIKSDPHRGGLHILLEAINDQACESQFEKLIIGGLDHEEQNHFSKRVQRTSINIEWRGKLSRAEVQKAISESHIGIVPSLHEAFSITTAEFAAGGLTVVASNTEGIPEGAKDFATFFESGDPIALREALLTVADQNLTARTISYGHLEMTKRFQELLLTIA